MMTSFASLLVALVAALPQAEDAARLIPTDATVLVRFQSLAEVADFANSIAADIGEQEQPVEPEALLLGMQCPFEAAALDLRKPIYLAVSVDPNTPVPALTWVAGVADAAAAARLESEMSSGPVSPVFQGEYVGLSMRTGYAAQEAPSPLVSALRPGLVSVHVDLATLLLAFRPLIDTGLKQARIQMESVPDEDMPFDLEPLTEEYFDGIEALLESAQSFGMALERQGSRIALVFDFLARAGSALDGWESGAPADLGALARYIDPAGAVTMLGAFDWQEFQKHFGSFVEAAFDVYPEPFSTELAGLWDAQIELFEQLQPGVASSFDLGADGLHGIYALHARDGAAAHAAFQALAARQAGKEGLFHMKALDSMTQGGLELSVWSFDFDWERITQAFDAAGDEAEEARQVRDMLGKVYGTDLRLGVAQRDNVLILMMGNEAALTAALATVTSPAPLRPGLARALERSGGGTPSLAYHLDLGRFVRAFGEIMKVLSPEGIDLPQVELGIDYWASIRGALWSGGIAADMTQFTDMVRAMQELEDR